MAKPSHRPNIVLRSFPNHSQLWAVLPGSFAQVKSQVHKAIAKLLAWSLTWASAGIFPSQGLGGEEFGKRTYRYANKGNKLSGGWRFHGVIKTHEIKSGSIFCQNYEGLLF